MPHATRPTYMRQAYMRQAYMRQAYVRQAYVRQAYPRLACLSLAFACVVLVGCSSNDTGGNTGSNTTAPSTVTAPSTTTDPGSRYLDPTVALGEVTVETPPIDASWTGGPTSIARPVAGTSLPRAPRLDSAGLPPPPVRPTPPLPPPPPLR